ncbi:MAG: M48 family metalloprotease [Proteobacteria bacterium]|nr:M48 family metalloprotease [Pseudomonadota bacterium]
MRFTRILGHAMFGLGALTLAACEPAGGHRAGLTPETSAVRSASEQREGDQNHRKIVARFGGVYENSRVTAYVDGIGQRIARVSAQPAARWTFTVLDSPTVNAFAIPGGYVYVTRGLVALAGDEAQLAGVLGHEIGHVVAGHSALRRSRGTMAGIGLLAGAIGLSVLGVDPTVAGGLMDLGRTAAGGYLAQNSRGDELDADNLGIRYLARAGYDPYAQADFLDRMSASAQLQARIAGDSYDPNRVDFFASHPATGLRTRQAIEVAQAAGAVATAGANRNRERFLAAIDGMVYGDSAAQGFVDGRTFSHPKLRFTFTAPRGFTITNSANAVVATGPRKSRFIMDSDRNRGGALTDYIARVWAPGLAGQFRTGRLGGLRRERINGLEAASAVLPVRLGNRTFDALLVAYRLEGKLYRITGLAPRGSGLLPAMTEAARSFRRLSGAEAGRLREKRISIVTVRGGDTPARLARRMNFDDYRVERFRVLNGLRRGEPLRAGQRVKLVR